MIDEYEEWSTGFWIVLGFATLGVLVLLGLGIASLLGPLVLVG